MAYLRCVKIDAPSTHGSIVLELPNVSFTRMHSFFNFSWPHDYILRETIENMKQIHVVDPDYKISYENQTGCPREAATACDVMGSVVAITWRCIMWRVAGVGFSPIIITLTHFYFTPNNPHGFQSA